MAPILVHKNEAELGQHWAKSSAPERSWGSIKANVGVWWWGTCPGHTWQGRGQCRPAHPAHGWARGAALVMQGHQQNSWD